MPCVRLLRAPPDRARVRGHGRSVSLRRGRHGAVRVPPPPRGGQLYAGGIRRDAHRQWARRIEAWRCGAEPEDAKRIDSRPAPAAKRRDVYVYFDNDAKVRAPFDALSLERKVAPLSGRAVSFEPARHSGDGATPSLTPEQVETRRVEMADRWKLRRARS